MYRCKLKIKSTKLAKYNASLLFTLNNNILKIIKNLICLNNNIFYIYRIQMKTQFIKTKYYIKWKLTNSKVQKRMVKPNRK